MVRRVSRVAAVKTTPERSTNQVLFLELVLEENGADRAATPTMAAVNMARDWLSNHQYVEAGPRIGKPASG